MNGPLPLAQPASSNRRRITPEQIGLFAMGLVGMLYLGSLFRTAYYAVRALVN